MISNKKENRQTFWIAYADLMAGLLFVFIVLMGGIIVKYVLTQKNLNKREQDVSQLSNILKNQSDKKAQLEALNKIFGAKLEKLELENSELKAKNSIYIVQLKELENLSSNLKEQKDKIEQEKLKQGKIINEDELKIALLIDKFSKKEKDFNKILADLNYTKNKIKNLAGVKIKVIADLKEAFGKNVKINPKSGSLSLSSAILFDKGSSVIKKAAKPALEKLLKKYFDVLLNNPEIRSNLSQIIIEGHTDSDGSYIYNLELSQQRAYAVMKFINSWNKDPRLNKYLIASGKSYMSPIIKNGKEDKQASRRIEIKFTLSNKEAIEQIQKFLNYDEN